MFESVSSLKLPCKRFLRLQALDLAFGTTILLPLLIQPVYPKFQSNSKLTYQCATLFDKIGLRAQPLSLCSIWNQSTIIQ